MHLGKGLFLPVHVDSNWMERNKTLIRCGTYSIKELIRENQHLSLIMHTWAALKDKVKSAKILWTITEPCSNREFSIGELKKLPYSENLGIFHGLMIWKVMRRNVWSDNAS